MHSIIWGGVIKTYLMNIQKFKKAFSSNSCNELPNIAFKKRKIPRPLVAKLSRGNVNLQLERYSLESDIDRRRNIVCSYSYID